MVNTPFGPAKTDASVDPNKSPEKLSLMARMLNMSTPIGMSIAVISLEDALSTILEKPYAASNTLGNCPPQFYVS